MLKKVEKIFDQFNISMKDVKDRLRQVGENAYLKTLENPGELKFLSHPLFFAMASLHLKNVHNVLEIGVGTGSGTMRLSKLFPNAMIYTIDVPSSDPKWKTCSIIRRKKNGEADLKAKLGAIGNIKYILTNSFFLPMLSLPSQFDLIFVDGDHTYPIVASDISYSYARIRPGGFLFMDNYEVVPKAYQTTQAIEILRGLIKEEILILPLYLNPPSYVDLQRLALLVKK